MEPSKKMHKALTEGNSYRVLDLKRLKQETASISSIFSKALGKVLKPLVSMEKNLPTFEELAENCNITFDEMKDLIWYLYEEDFIIFVEILPFLEEKLTMEKGRSLLEKLEGLGLLNRALFKESLELLESVLPYIENSDNTLDYITRKVNVKPMKLREFLDRFKVDWIPIELE